MYHVGRPGEDGYTERVLAAWGVDGHNSHTNICSSSGRAGYHYWMGLDRPSPDYANADVILLISSHLEAGHYFNPHAQRIIEGKSRGAKLIIFDVRLSNSATHADYWVSPQPGSEAAILLAIANHLIQQDRYNHDFVRRWWNWQEYLQHERPDFAPTFENFDHGPQDSLSRLYVRFRRSGVRRRSTGHCRDRRHRQSCRNTPRDPHVAQRHGRQSRWLAGFARALSTKCIARCHWH